MPAFPQASVLMLKKLLFSPEQDSLRILSRRNRGETGHEALRNESN